MANSARPNGLQAIRTSDGAYLRVNRYWAPASLASLGIGTPVNLGGTSNSANTTNGQETLAGTLPSIVVATSGDTNKLLGAIVGFELLPLDLFKAGYNAASTGRIVYVADHPEQQFSIVDDGASALAITDVGNNANLTVGTVDAFTNVDSTSLDTTTPGTTSTFQLKILSVLDTPGNTAGEVYCQWKVQINNHVLANITTGV